MANSDNAYGLRPVRHKSGAPYNGAANLYHLRSDYATDVFVGDPVIKTGNADTRGVPDVELATVGDTNRITGVVVGFVTKQGQTNVNFDDTVRYGKASTTRYAMVCDDPDVVFSIQDDASATLTADSVGLNANVAAGTGSTTSGLSLKELDATTPSADASNQLIILRLLDVDGNEIGDNAEWEVMINQHTENQGTVGTLGIA